MWRTSRSGSTRPRGIPAGRAQRTRLAHVDGLQKWAPPRTTLVALGASRVAAGAKSEAAAGASAERNICVVAISRDTDLCGVHWARRARAERAKNCFGRPWKNKTKRSRLDGFSRSVIGDPRATKFRYEIRSGSGQVRTVSCRGALRGRFQLAGFQLVQFARLERARATIDPEAKPRGACASVAHTLSGRIDVPQRYRRGCVTPSIDRRRAKRAVDLELAGRDVSHGSSRGG